MPLDSGGVTQLYRTGDIDPVDSLVPTEEPSLHHGPDIGAALKAAREFRGLSLQDVADQTRIRRTYLAAVEDMRLEELPSRPFTLGYVKAYAKLLGLDPDEAVARFKDAAPEAEDDLRAPVGVRKERDPRMGAIMAGAALIVTAIILWNIAQRAISEEAPPPPTAPQSAMAAAPTAPAGPMSVGAPLPAPTEASTPPVYETPGLEAAAQAGGSADAAMAAGKARREAEAAAAVQSDTPVGAAFVAKGPIHGAPAASSAVTLQARRQTMLIVRGGDSAIYFARSLAPGEAYRLPASKGLTVEATDPRAIDVFVGGRFKSLMPAPQTTAAALAG
ncbi:cell division protein FtsQ [Caulobacter mirabilis]|uniref:Cell division protein FtsQ n=1 Tax=Caulobacter mirabilis TaxID=69666 RepID=A0A2D2AUG2_9CAUL|nr:cell division protein FtsQ [Caulobacter mirabilis]